MKHCDFSSKASVDTFISGGKSCDRPSCLQYCNFYSIYEFVILQKASLDTSQYQEQGDDGKSCDFPSCLQCSNFSFYEFVILQKTSHDTSQYQEALARWPRKSFSCLTVTCLVAQIPPAKTFQMLWTLCIIYCKLYIVQYTMCSYIACKHISGLRMQLMMQKAIIDKEFKAFSKKSKKMRPRRLPEVFRFNRSAVGIQRKRVQLAECDLARGVSAVALKRVHLVQYFISSCFILYHFLAKDIRAVALLTFKRVQLVQYFIFQG